MGSTATVVQNLRGTGKTTHVMEILHDRYLRGLFAETVVVFPDSRYISWWVRQWQHSYPSAPVPHYVIARNTLSLRGKWLSLIVVEDVDKMENGVWDEKIQYLETYLVSRPDNPSEILFTSSPIDLNGRSHNRMTSREDVTRSRLAVARKNLLK